MSTTTIFWCYCYSFVIYLLFRWVSIESLLSLHKLQVLNVCFFPMWNTISVLVNDKTTERFHSKSIWCQYPTTIFALRYHFSESVLVFRIGSFSKWFYECIKENMYKCSIWIVSFMNILCAHANTFIWDILVDIILDWIYLFENL